MKFNLYDNVKEFHQDVHSILLTHEAQNMLILGNLKIGYEGKDKHDWRDPVNWVMATVVNEEEILLTALMTPPFGITLYAKDNLVFDEAIKCLVDGLINSDILVPGVVSEKGLAQRFAEIYGNTKGVGFDMTMSQRIYELTEVNPDVLQLGELRLLNEKDMAFFPYWAEEMNSAVFGVLKAVGGEIDPYLYSISAGNSYVLEVDGMPVSMAKISRELEQVCGIAMVYTPPYFRGKGYASSCVAKLSQVALERGFSGCVLYTDLANPTSNSIYQKVGYQEICDSLEIKFEEIG